MKRTLLGTALFLGLSATGFSQTTDVTGTINLEAGREAVIVDKKPVSSTQHVYRLKDVVTGVEYESLPTQAQKAIGEHAPMVSGGMSPLYGSITIKGELAEGDGQK